MKQQQVPMVLTVREVADYFQVHPSSIYRLLKRRAIPAFKLGSDWRFMAEDIDRWRDGIEQDNGVKG